MRRDRLRWSWRNGPRRGRFAATLVLSALVAVLLPRLPVPDFRLPSLAAQATCLVPEQAGAHVGERGCVEGTVTQATYAPRSNGQPTFLDFGPRFTAVIWGEDRAKFNPPPETLRGRQMRVTGRIDTFRDKAQIVVREPDQLAPAGSAPLPRATVSQSPSATTSAEPGTPAPPASLPTTAPIVVPAPEAAIPTVTVISPSPLPVQTVDGLARVVTVVPAATAAPTPEPVDEEGGASPGMVAAGIGLIVVGGAGAAWYRLRRR